MTNLKLLSFIVSFLLSFLVWDDPSHASFVCHDFGTKLKGQFQNPKSGKAWTFRIECKLSKEFQLQERSILWVHAWWRCWWMRAWERSTSLKASFALSDHTRNGPHDRRMKEEGCDIEGFRYRSASSSHWFTDKSCWCDYKRQDSTPMENGVWDRRRGDETHQQDLDSIFFFFFGRPHW